MSKFTIGIGLGIDFQGTSNGTALVTGGYLLQQNGFKILQEDGFGILLE